MNAKHVYLVVTWALVVAAVVASCGASSTGRVDQSATTSSQPITSLPGQKDSAMRIRLTLGGDSATARLYDNATARDFASLLPMSITVHDLGGREKAGKLPRELTGGQGQSEYRAGQLGYWPPAHDLAVYYHEDGFRIPGPGIVMIGEIDSGLETIIGASDHDTLTLTAAN